MHTETAVQQTLRTLMKMQDTLRTNISVFHGSHVTNLVLELARARDGGLSAVELCPEGELITGQRIDTDHVALDEQALTVAMQQLWSLHADAGDTIDDVVSIRATSLWMANQSDEPFRIVQSWYYRSVDKQGLLDVWGDGHMVPTRAVPTPAKASLRALVASLQSQASWIQLRHPVN